MIDRTTRTDEEWAALCTRTGRRIDLVHRTTSATIGIGLIVFGALGLARGVAFFSTVGHPVLGMPTNGLLSTISVVVGGVLVAAALRAGRTASTIGTVVGCLFLLSGLVNVLLLDTPLNILAFGMRNVIFSFVVGALLVCTAAYGRFTGRLPPDSPYAHPGALEAIEDSEDFEDASRSAVGGVALRGDAPEAAAARELAEAERAVAERHADPATTAAVRALDGIRRPEDRIHAWQERHT